MRFVRGAYQKGLGLPELLIALLLSSFIMTGLMHHYLSTKKQYADIQKKLERNIDLQLVTDLIRESVRKAGFTPCLGIDHLVTLDQRSEPKRLVGVDIGSESLRINRMSEDFSTVVHVTSPMQLFIQGPSIHSEQSVLIADCYHAEVQKISQVTDLDAGQKITLNKPLAFTYHEPIYIGKWLEETYSIRLGQNGKRALFYQCYKHAEELTMAVQAFSAHLTDYRGCSLLKIILLVDKADSLKLETKIRAC